MRTPKHWFMHAHTLKPICPPNLQISKRKKKEIPLHTHTNTSMHITFIVPALMHSRVHLERKKKEKAKVGCDWRVHCSYKTNLHTQRLRSEYAWENKTICLEADHPLSLDYSTHLRAFYLLVGVQSSWFSVHLLMVSYSRLDLKDDDLLRKTRKMLSLKVKRKDHFMP